MEADRPLVVKANISETGLVFLQFSKPLLIPNAFKFFLESETSKNLTYSLFDLEVLSDFHL